MTDALPDGGGEFDPQAPLPALRPLEAYPVTHEGERRIVLRDTLDVAGGVLMVPVPVYYLTAQLDGRSSIRDLQADFASRFGHLVPAEQGGPLEIELDGVIDEEAWERAEWQTWTYEFEVARGDAIAPDFLPVTPEDDFDLEWAAVADEQFLYVACRIRDDSLRNLEHAQCDVWAIWQKTA